MKLTMFYMPGCPHCALAFRFLDELRQRGSRAMPRWRSKGSTRPEQTRSGRQLRLLLRPLLLSWPGKAPRGPRRAEDIRRVLDAAYAKPCAYKIKKQPRHNGGLLFLYLFCSQGRYRIFLRSLAGRNYSGHKRQRHAQEDEYGSVLRRKIRVDGRTVPVSECITAFPGISSSSDTPTPMRPDAHARYEGLGVEDLGNIAFRRADGPEYAYLLCALKHGDIGYNSDHNAGHHQRHAHEGYQNV
jgi:hypothetical protein